MIQRLTLARTKWVTWLTKYYVIFNCWYLDHLVSPYFISSMRTGPHDWRAKGHREITSSFSQVFFKFPKCFGKPSVSVFFSCYWFLMDVWWVVSASRMIKRFVVIFIVTDIMCRHSPLHHNTEVFAGFTNVRSLAVAAFDLVHYSMSALRFVVFLDISE